MSTWKDSFRRQTDNGKYWRNLYQEDFDKQRFLERSDAENICKKAQADAYENVIKTLQGKVDESIITEIKQLIVDLWEEDTSALGITYKGKTY